MEQGHYGDVKDRLSRVLAEFAQLAERREGPGPAVRARQLLAKLDAERFNVVVVGEFKRGKTTFVNALLGAPVLPAAVVPLTSIVTAVGYAEKIEVEVTFRDGRRESVPVETISAYVTEPENPHNRLGVRQVMLSYPSPQIRGGVFLVDTPGVGSIYAHNTEAAYEFVPEADAAIFLTSADPPISARERDFLIDVREYAERMFFISNKVDYLSDTERAESLAFTRRVLREALGSEPVLYPLSAKLALEARMRGDAAGLEASGLAAFERDFHDFLMREKGRAFLGSVGMQAAKLEADLNNALAVEEQSVRLPLEELRRRSDAMEVLFRDARIRRDDTGALLKKEFDAIVRMIEEDLEAIKAQHIEPLLRQVEEWVRASPDARAAAAGVDEQVQESIRRAFDHWRAAEEKTVAVEFDRRVARLVQATNDLVAETVRLCGGLMEVELETASLPVALSARSHFFYNFTDPPSIMDGLVPNLRPYLPKGMAKRRILESLRLGVARVLERQASSAQAASRAAEVAASGRAELHRIAAELRDALKVVEGDDGMPLARGA